jgi:hypothetical protein
MHRASARGISQRGCPKAVKFFNTDNKTILRYVRNGRIFREKWILSSSLK